MSELNLCEKHFNIPGDYIFPPILLFPELHDNQQDDAKIADCMRELVDPHDRLLIEVEDTGGKVDCGQVNPIYKNFNTVLDCYEFDVKLDQNRLLYNTHGNKANLLYMIGQKLIGQGSVRACKKELTSLVKKLEKTKLPKNHPEPNFYQKQAKYVKKFYLIEISVVFLVAFIDFKCVANLFKNLINY